MALVWLRWIAIAVFALKQAAGERRERAEHLRLLRAKGWPPVSIVVPAYNEEQLIGETLERLLRLGYPHMEVIVVNDGSLDATGAVIEKLISADGPRPRYIDRRTNQGKAAALNLGVARAAHDIILTIDADTVLSLRSLKYLMLCFMDESIAAATSNVRVGNPRSVLTRWQELEYITGLHTERRAQSHLNCITTLSGAACAYRRDALQSAGGFSCGTLVEDTEMTLRLAATNVPMRFASRAISYSEAPWTLGDLARQRFRWLYGSLQCIRLHLGAWTRTSNTALRCFGFPNFVYNNLLVFFIYPIYVGYIAVLMGDFSPFLLALVASFLLVETLISLLACLLSGRGVGILVHVVPQRLFYMFFLFVIFLRCLGAFLMKRRPGWLKVGRSGTWLRR